MTWTIIISLIPIAKEFVGEISKAIKGPRKREAFEKRFWKMLTDNYNRQFSTVNKDIGIIKGWKPILARVQAISITLKRWELFAMSAAKYKNESLINDIISEKKINSLIDEIESVNKTIDNLSEEFDITWREGKTDLKVSILQLKKDVNDLKTDFKRLKNDFQENMENLIDNTRNAYDETIYFFVFWDFVLEELVKGSAKAVNAYEKEIGTIIKKELPKVKSEYPTESWEEIVKGTLDKVGELDFSGAGT
jgi:methyl-accepting chemotaxis protein